LQERTDERAPAEFGLVVLLSMRLRRSKGGFGGTPGAGFVEGMTL
jgi:hypothetical protein